jgi:hypothetical protein
MMRSITRMAVAGVMRNGTVISLGSLMVAAALSTAGAQALPQASWEVVGEMDSPVSSGVVIPLGDARALLTGSDGHDASRVELYQPASGLATVADAPAPLYLHFGARLLDGRVLVGGGGNFRDRENLTDRCFLYDPATDSWSEAAPLPRPSIYFYGNTARTLLDGRVMVTGGSTPAEAYFDPGVGFDLYLASRNVFLFDPNGGTVGPGGQMLAGSWMEGRPMPVTRVFATHAPAFTGAGIALGAEDTPPQGAPAGRVAHEMVVLSDGRVLLIGGREYNPGHFYGVSPIDAYDPSSDAWTRIAELPSVPGDGDAGYGGRGFPGVTLLPSGELLIFGGIASELVELANTNGRVTFVGTGTLLPRGSSLLFDPATGDFSQVGSLNVRRSAPLAVAWPEGSGAFAIGGNSIVWDQPVPMAEVYDPSARVWFLLPLEPEAELDFTWREGTALTDGTVLTWSALPYWDDPHSGGAGGLRTVKRLHPAD